MSSDKKPSAEHDYINHVFFAKEQKDELRCPEIELNRLDKITDVTARVKAATEGKSGEAYSKAEKAIKSAIEKECAGKDSATTRCDVVDLYHGGVFSLYQYHRIQDVRLAFAPELEAAFFGGDPDNFNFPRYDLDMGLLRAYENGKPVKPKDYFPFSKDGAAEGEMTVIVGNPGGTDRQLTVAQLELARDDQLVSYLLFLAERRGLLTQFRNENAENWRIAQSDLFGTENSYKVLRGRLSALQDPAVFDLKRAQETELREFVDADPARRQKYGAAWDEIAKAVAVERNILGHYSYVEGGRGFYTRYYDYARMLVRGAAERSKPDAERLREYTDSKLPALTQRLFSTAPVYADYEKVKLGWSLTKLREVLGTGDAFVKKVLGNESPEALAKRLVEGSKLGDPAVRKALWDGGADAIAESDDPFIVLARAVDGDALEALHQLRRAGDVGGEQRGNLLGVREELLELRPLQRAAARSGHGELTRWHLVMALAAARPDLERPAEPVSASQPAGGVDEDGFQRPAIGRRHADPGRAVLMQGFEPRAAVALRARQPRIAGDALRRQGLRRGLMRDIHAPRLSTPQTLSISLVARPAFGFYTGTKALGASRGIGERSGWLTSWRRTSSKKSRPMPTPGARRSP